MADKRFDIISVSSFGGLQIPRWLKSAIDAAAKLSQKDWNGELSSSTMEGCRAAQDVLAAFLANSDWEQTAYNLWKKYGQKGDQGEYSLDDVLNLTAADVGHPDATLLSLLSDSMWIKEEHVKNVLQQQWALWDKNKKPSDPSQALLKYYDLDNASKGTSVTPSKKAPDPDAPPPPKPDIPPIEEPEDDGKGEGIGIGTIVAIAAGGLFAAFVLPKLFKKQKPEGRLKFTKRAGRRR